MTLVSFSFPLPSSKSELTTDFSDRQSTASSLKCTLASLRPPQCLPHLHRRGGPTPRLRFTSNDKGIDSMILNFGSKLCGSMITPSFSKSLPIERSEQGPFNVLDLLCGGSRGSMSKVNGLVL
ncbi:hypothetical protein AAG906_010129 [Vitis piasezkii]